MILSHLKLHPSSHTDNSPILTNSPIHPFTHSPFPVDTALEMLQFIGDHFQNISLG